MAHGVGGTGGYPWLFFLSRSPYPSLSLSAGPAGVGPWFIDVWWDRHSCCRGLYKCKEAVSVCFIRRTTDEGQVEKSTAVCGAQKKLETKIESRAKAHPALPLTPSPLRVLQLCNVNSGTSSIARLCVCECERLYVCVSAPATSTTALHLTLCFNANSIFPLAFSKDVT